MKKLFLIPLMTLMTCVMAWGVTTKVSNFAGLQQVLAGASDGDTIKLTADIIYRSTSENTCGNIKRSVIIDGQGHSITGYACRGTRS